MKAKIGIKIRPDSYEIEYGEGDCQEIKKEILMHREIRENIKKLTEIIRVHDVLETR